MVALDQRGRDQAQDLGGDVHRRRVDEREVIVLLQAGREVGFGQQPELHQRRAERRAVGALLLVGLRELCRGDQSASDQQLTETGTHCVTTERIVVAAATIASRYWGTGTLSILNLRGGQGDGKVADALR